MSGRLSRSLTKDHVAAVQKAIDRDRRVTIDAIAEEVGISHGNVHTFLWQNLGLSKLSVRWVPRLLHPEHKIQRIECAMDLLVRLATDREDFLPAMRLGSFNTIPSPRSNPRSGYLAAPPVQRRFVPTVQLRRFWQLFSGTLRQSSWWTSLTPLAIWTFEFF